LTADVATALDRHGSLTGAEIDRLIAD